MDYLYKYLPRRFKSLNFKSSQFSTRKSWCRWTFRTLILNKFGIPEPLSNKIKYPNILLVPLVAFDKDLNRIGYGGGFYDRYISKIKKRKKIISIGLAYSFQKVKKIPIKGLQDSKEI